MTNLLERLAEWHENTASEWTRDIELLSQEQPKMPTGVLRDLARKHLATAAALRECIAHREYPSDDEMNTGDPENEAVNLMKMARLGTCMDDTDSLLTQAFPEDKR